MVLIADAQSSNVLCAELAFGMNDSFGTAGLKESQIAGQMTELAKNLAPSENKRLLSRLIDKQLVIDSKQKFFVDPSREALEYLHFLYGILDDTDLLTKVSTRDLECVVSLLNRLKSLMMGRQVEVIALNDIPRDKNFVRTASARILQNPDMYSLYRKIYLAKEEGVDESIALAAKGKASTFFIDTKEQNGCARVGQAKLFACNYPGFFKQCATLRQRWYENLLDVFRERSEFDLHMQMISTVAGADDLFAGVEGAYKHKDELWLWIPFTEQSIEHLKSFLNALRTSPQIHKGEFSAEFYGDRAKDYEQIFKESFLPIPTKIIKEKGALPIAVLKYKAGLINSRKAMISPYLPKLVE